MSDSSPQPWEVWHARFNFSEGHGYKYRPIVILATRADGALVTMVTSATNKMSLPHDYLLHEWRNAGLEKPSIVRLDRIAEIPPNYLGTAGRIGRLTDKDIAAIKVILSDIIR